MTKEVKIGKDKSEIKALLKARTPEKSKKTVEAK